MRVRDIAVPLWCRRRARSASGVAPSYTPDVRSCTRVITGVHRDVRTCSRLTSRRAGGEFLVGTPRRRDVAFESANVGCTSGVCLVRDARRGRTRSLFAGGSRPGRVWSAPVAVEVHQVGLVGPRARQIRVPVGGADRRRGVFWWMGKALDPPQPGPAAAQRARMVPWGVLQGPTGGQSGLGDHRRGDSRRPGGGWTPSTWSSTPLRVPRPAGGSRRGGSGPPSGAHVERDVVDRRPDGGCRCCQGPWGEVYEHCGPPGGGQDDPDDVRKGGHPPRGRAASGRALCRDDRSGPARPSPGPTDPLVALLGAPGGAHGGCTA